MKNVLIIDDDFDFREVFAMILAERDCAVWEASSTEEAFGILHNEERFDLIFCDLHLPFTLGEQSADYLYTEEVGIRTIAELCWVYGGEVPVVAISSAPAVDILALRARLGDVPLLEKPIREAALDVLLSSSAKNLSLNHFEFKAEQAVQTSD